jgi:hypothetical protein
MWNRDMIIEGIHEQQSPDLQIWIGDILVMPDGKHWMLLRDGWVEIK